MKTFSLRSLAAIMVATAVMAFAPDAQAQKSRIKVGDGGTTINKIVTGRATLVAGVIAVADTSITATTNIWVERQTIAGTAGQTYDITRTPGTSFTITARAADGTTAATGDTSVIAYFYFQP